MYRHRLAASAALALVVGGVVPSAALADTPTGTVIYVNNATGSNCVNSGTGLQTAPLCTIQEAASIATAGQTVSVAPGNYTAGATITASGTSGAPISFVTGAAGGYSSAADIEIPAGLNSTGLTVDNAQWVTIQDFVLTSGTNSISDSVLVENSSNVIVNGVNASGAAAGISVELSPNVTVERSSVSTRNGSTALWLAGGGNDVLTTNFVRLASDANAIIDNGSSGADITSNTVIGGCFGIVVDPGEPGDPTNVTIENNIVGYQSCVSGGGGGAAMLLQSSQLPTVNDNIVYPNTVGTAAYQVLSGTATAPTNYATSAAFYAATGQGSADLNVDPGLGNIGVPALTATSPAINSANSDAPGELATDIDNNPRSVDPLVPETGAGTYKYYDRGAAQYQDPYTPAASDQFSGSAGTHIVTGTPTSLYASGTDTWGDPVTYLFDFGDGTKVSSATGSASHTYSTPGRYQVQASGVVNGVVRFTIGSALAVVGAPAPTVLSTSSGALNLYQVRSDGNVWGDAQSAPGGTFNGWKQLSATGEFVGAPAAVLTSNGTIGLFARTSSGAVKGTSQSTPGGAFGAWTQISNSTGLVSDPTVLLTKSNVIAIYAANSSGGISGASQSAPYSAFGAWGQLGASNTFSGKPAVIQTSNGTIAVYAHNNSAAILGISQSTPGGTFGSWAQLSTTDGLDLLSDPTVLLTKSNVIAVYAANAAGGISGTSQSAPFSAFSTWGDLGPDKQSLFGKPAVIQTTNGTIALYGTSTTGTVLGTSQSVPGGTFGAWGPISNSTGLVSDPTVLLTKSNVIAIYAVNPTDGISGTSQSAPYSAFSPWGQI